MTSKYRPGVLRDPNTGYLAKGPKVQIPQNSLLPRNRVTVQLTPHETGTFISVEIFSTRGGGQHSAIGTIQADASEWETQRKVMIVAGATAEHLCERYGDRLDPAQCAKDALVAWKEQTYRT